MVSSQIQFSEFYLFTFSMSVSFGAIRKEPTELSVEPAFHTGQKIHNNHHIALLELSS